MELEKNLRAVLDKIAESALLVGRRPEEIKLLAVTKGCTVATIQEAYFLGLRDFAENRVDEALHKMSLLPADINWHFIGKLQKKKVNKVIGKFALIHSVDTFELADKIAHASFQRGVKTAILLEVHTSDEATKSGLQIEECERRYPELQRLNGIEIQGLMTMAPLTEDETAIRNSFAKLRLLKMRLQTKGYLLHILSMGMSNDFSLAIQEGSTVIRIGSALFHPPYAKI